MSRTTPWNARTLHLVGIGGCGMSGLALVADALGAHVTGSDLRETPFLAPLRRRGIRIALGHDAANVPSNPGTEIVHSSAIGADNPERIAARARHLPSLHRGALLAEVAASRRCIAVAGTHGKTTTTAMIAHALVHTGARPGFVIGAPMLGSDVNAAWGAGEWVVVETDESDRSLLTLHPEIAVLTNVEHEHVRVYASRAEVGHVFRQFLAQARHATVWDRPDVLALRAGPCVPFDAHEIRLTAGGSRFRWRGHDVVLNVAGAHNARNAAAALEACRLTGADGPGVIAALATFPGTARRLQELGRTRCGARVFDDYAHHPTAIAATIAAARSYGAERLVAVLQPHSYARVRAMAGAFGSALAGADIAVVLPIVGRERPQDHPGIDAAVIADAARAAGAPEVHCAEGLDAATDLLDRALRPGDLCLTLSSPDIGRLTRRLLSEGHDLAHAVAS